MERRPHAAGGVPDFLRAVLQETDRKARQTHRAENARPPELRQLRHQRLEQQRAQCLLDRVESADLAVGTARRVGKDFFRPIRICARACGTPQGVHARRMRRRLDALRKNGKRPQPQHQPSGRLVRRFCGTRGRETGFLRRARRRSRPRRKRTGDAPMAPGTIFAEIPPSG